MRHALIGRKLASKVRVYPSLNPFGMAGYVNIGIFGSRTSEHTGWHFLAESAEGFTPCLMARFIYNRCGLSPLAVSRLQGERLSGIAYLGSVGYAGFVIFRRRTFGGTREQCWAVNQQVLPDLSCGTA